ncbi:MAG: hypothetical protein ACR2KK_00705 [Acidimicrobiales bacterium]
MLVLAGCRTDSSSDDPLTESTSATPGTEATGSPGATAAPGSGAVRCPLPALGGGVIDATTKPGDFDGNGVADTLRTYKVTGEWHLRVELDGGQSGDDLVVPADPSSGLKAVGGFNVGGNVADEAFAIVSSGASATSIAIFTFTNCKLVQVGANDRVTTFLVEALPDRRSGLRCVAGTELQVLNAAVRPRTTTPFTATRTTFKVIGSALVRASVSPEETYAADDPRLVPFGRFDCGSLSLN